MRIFSRVEAQFLFLGFDSLSQWKFSRVTVTETVKATVVNAQTNEVLITASL